MSSKSSKPKPSVTRGTTLAAKVKGESKLRPVSRTSKALKSAKEAADAEAEPEPKKRKRASKAKSAKKAPKKARKAAKKASAKKTLPKGLLGLAVQAIGALARFGRGASRGTISAYVKANSGGQPTNAVLLRAALKRGVAEGVIVSDGARHAHYKIGTAANRAKAARVPKVAKAKAAKAPGRVAVKKVAKRSAAGGRASIVAVAAAEPGDQAQPAPAQSAPKKKPSVARQETHLEEGASVLDDGETRWQAQLVQLDLSTNTDKYYHFKIVKTTGGNYELRQHWGRTGTIGQRKTDACEDEAAAKKLFEKRFREKTGAAFSERETYTAAKGKYSYKKLEQDVDADDVVPANLAKGVKWQYYIDDGVDGKADGWYDYAQSATENVEGVHSEWTRNSWLSVRCVQSGHFAYTVDFNTMQQTNISTKKMRKIRRWTGE